MSVTHTIGIAGLKLIRQPDRIRTVLGSCVGIGVYDRVAKIGALGHVILPSSEIGSGDRGKFADTAVDWLVDEVLAAGCVRERIRAKIAGGAFMFGAAAKSGIGERNLQAVKERLLHHRVPLVAEAVGGEKGRKMMLDPATGIVEVQVIGTEAITI